MNKRDEEMAVLNDLLQGTYIGIDSYAKCLNKIKDKNIRHKLEMQELEQREMAMELASRIRDLGGTPKDSAGVKGTMASVMGSLQLAEKEDTSDILDLLSKGAKMGIDSNEKSLGKLNGPSKKIVEKHLKEDRKIFNEIEDLKSHILIH